MPLQRLRLLRALGRHARSLAGPTDVTPILEAIGDASVVLLGEATHGSHEFYRLRAEITQRLILDRGFDAVAVEADWPDALQASRWLHGEPAMRNVDDALEGFTRFPRWMWRNREVREFLQWLRRHNDVRPAPMGKVGFFGLDLYSLRASMASVIDYLQATDPVLAEQARERYECFNGLADQPQRYGERARRDAADSCEDAVVQQLRALLGEGSRLLHLPTPAGRQPGDELFYAQQNARVVLGAEQYYRTLYRGGAAAWNLRDTHMADTLMALGRHLATQRGRPARVVVWAHNSHIGDAGATEMGDTGQLNLGQLVRARAAEAGREADVFLLGFTTHAGHVAAAADWNEPVRHLRVLPSHGDSVERLFHDAGLGMALVPLKGELREPLAERRLERAIGVIYRPDTERWSHYFETRLSRQFDAVVHVDETRAVTPIDPSAVWRPSPMEETFPTGL